MDRGVTTRRAVLRGLAAAGLVGLVPAPAAAADTGSASGTGWRALDAVTGGGLATPLDARYGSAKQVFNTRFDTAVPVAVVAPTRADQVGSVLALARDLGLRVAVRSGGHSYVGASTATGALVLDLRRLPGGVVVGPDTVTVTPGTGLGSLQRTLAAAGRSVPVGTCPTVGVGGLALGGGVGIDSRTAGLTCDRLVSAEVVLPSRGLVTATATQDADVFWACRGGAGSVGVVVSMTFRTESARDRDVVAMTFDDPVAPDAVEAAMSWTQDRPREVWGTATVATDGANAVSATVLVTTPPGEGSRAAADLERIVGTAPRAAQTVVLDQMGVLDLFARYSPKDPHPFVGGSDVLRTVDAATAAAVVDAVRARRTRGRAASAIIDPLGGAVSDIDTDATAFPWRSHAAVVQWVVDPLAPGDEASDAAAWIGEAHSRVAGVSDGGYVNYLETGMPAQRWFAGNTDRLADTRRRHDPESRIVSPVFA